MKKRLIRNILIALLCAALALGCLAVSAAGEGTITTWAELQSAINDGGTVQLTGDVAARTGDSILTVPTGQTVVLDLKGRNITGPQGSGVIINNGTLTIRDSGTFLSGNIIGRCTSTDANAGVIVNNGTLTLENGIITNYPQTTQAENLSAGVRVLSGSFTMEGGIIRQCPGFGVSVGGGSFTMTGGRISENGNDGVYNEGADTSFEMTGGTITNNAANGISLYDATFTLLDGTISENKEHGVFAAGTFAMSNAQISGNTRSGVFVSAGGVFTMNSGSILLNQENGVELHQNTNARMTMVDGVIRNNEGRGIKINQGTTVSMGGGIITANEGHGVSIDNGTFTNAGGYITDNLADGVYLFSGVFDMVTGSIGGNLNNGVSVDAGSFTMEGGFIYENRKNGIRFGSYTPVTGTSVTGCLAGGIIEENTENGVDILANGFVMNGGTITGNSSCGVHVHANADFTMTGGTVTENDGGVIPESGSRFILSGSPVVSGNTIVVNRKTVPLNTDLRGGKIITISDMLSSEACVGISQDNITGAFTDGLKGKGGMENFFCDDSSFGVTTDTNGEAIIIQAFSALQARIDAAQNGETVKLLSDVIAQPDEYCLKIELKSLILDLNGHTLNRNLDEPGGNNGSVIRVESGATLQIKDSSTYGRGLITGGWAVNGGGIFNAGTLSVTGGTVAGNKATGNGGGIYVHRLGVLNVSGKPMVYDNHQPTGNKDSNIQLDGSTVIHVTAALTDGALLRVSRPGITGIITSGYNEKNQGKAPASFFDPDYPGYRVALDGNEVSVERDSDESDEYVESVAYNVYSWEGSLKKTQVTDNHVPVFPKATDVPNGKYVVNRDITINSRVYLRSDTEIILMNGCTLDVKGLYIPYEATLTIYGQDDNTGSLVARASGNGAGIGAADAGRPGGRIIIHGGTVTAEGSKYSAGIGSSDGEAACGDIIIYDGTVTATGGEDGAGIGGGRACSGKRILIYGGDITANGGKHAAGIGGGAGIVESLPVRVTGGAAGTIEIRGGRITAVGGENGAGIGGGDNGNAGSITIRGGTVNASGRHWGAGIGCGGGIAKKQTDEALDFRGTGRGGTVTIYGGTVTATGGEFGSGIGGGNKNWCRTIDIHGGTVTALGGTLGNGIGPGPYGDYESADQDSAETRESRTITISGGQITATGGPGTTRRPDGSGIGGSTFYNGYRDKVPITLTYQGNPGQSNISIQASSYCGDVTLENPFRNTNTYFTVATYQQENTGIMSSSPLIAWDGYTCDDGDYVTVIDWKNAREQLQLGNNIRLETDITAAETDQYLNVPSGMKVQLDLNGYTLSRSRVYSTYNDTSCTDGFVIRNQGQLFITDSSEEKTGTITGGGNTGRTLKGGGICNEGLLVMTGGTVTGNYSLYGGGGIHNTGSMNLTGVRVIGNQGGHGGGICNEGAMNVSGFLQVNDNNGVADYSKGINVSGNEPIHIMGALSEDTRLHITPASSATTVITSGLSGNGSLDNFETNGSYVLGLNSDGEAIIGEGAVLTFVTPEGKTAHESITVAKDSVVSLPKGGEDDEIQFVPAGNSFRCWEIIDENKNVTPLPDGTLTVTGDTTLTAVWYYQEAADWYTLQLRLSEGCYVTMTKDISISYYDRFLKAVISRDAALDMNGHNLNGYSGPVFDITENGSLEIRNSGAQSVRMKAMYGTSLIVSRGHLVLEDNIQLSSDNSSYSDAVISALKGSLEIRGNVSVLQGPEGGPAIAVSSNSNDEVNVTIDTTGEVNGRIAVYPTSASNLNSSLTITNIYSSAAAANEYTPGGITAPLRAANVAEKINVSGGIWSAFLVDSYCAEGMVSVRMADGTYRILPADDSRIAAMNGSAIPNRYESLQDCVNLTHQPVQQPEIILLNDISLNGPVTVNRSSNILLDLNGHTISGTGAVYNKMIEDPETEISYALTILDSTGGGGFALKADPGSTTYLGDLHAEERKDSFTLSGMDTVDGTPAATVIATDDFAANNQISGWLWEDDNTVADDAKRLCRAIATLTQDGKTTTHASIDDALDQAETGGGAVLLLQNAELSETKYLTNETYINLDGYTLSTGRCSIYARGGGNVTFSNGIVESGQNGLCIAATEGSVTLAAGLTVNGKVAAANASSFLHIKGANVRSQNGEAVLLLSNGDPVTLEMTSGSVISENGPAVVAQNKAAKIIIQGGRIASESKNTNPAYGAGVYGASNCNVALEIYGGEITSASGNAVSVSGTRNVTVYGGTLRGDLSILEGGSQPAEMYINTGTIYGRVTLNSGYGCIYGGQIHGGVQAGNASLSIMGGRYGLDPSVYVPDGFVVIPPDASDNMYRVQPVSILTLPANLQTIESQAFVNTPENVGIRLPGALTDIAPDAFNQDVILLAPAGSPAAGWAREHQFRLIEE